MQEGEPGIQGELHKVNFADGAATPEILANADQTRFGVNAGENGGAGFLPSLHALPMDVQNSNLPPLPVAKAPLPSLESVLPALNSELGFVNLKDGHTLAFAQSSVQVKGGAGSLFKLRVNGVEIADNRVGQKRVAPDGKTGTWEFAGVQMKEGSNTLHLEQTDSFGIARGQVKIGRIVAQASVFDALVSERPYKRA